MLQVNSQTIHLVHVHPAGHLLPMHTIGQHCFPDDGLLLSGHEEQEAAWRDQHQVPPPPPPGIPFFFVILLLLSR